MGTKKIYLRIDTQITISKYSHKILKENAQHYKLKKSNFIDLIFIIEQDRDAKKIVINSNDYEEHQNFNNENEKVYISISTDIYTDMRNVAKYYNLSLSKYIEKLILKYCNNDNSNSLIESI